MLTNDNLLNPVTSILKKIRSWSFSTRLRENRWKTIATFQVYLIFNLCFTRWQKQLNIRICMFTKAWTWNGWRQIESKGKVFVLIVVKWNGSEHFFLSKRSLKMNHKNKRITKSRKLAKSQTLLKIQEESIEIYNL